MKNNYLCKAHYTHVERHFLSLISLLIYQVSCPKGALLKIKHLRRCLIFCFYLGAWGGTILSVSP